MLIKNNFNGGTNGVGISAANSGGVSGDPISHTGGTAPTYSTTNATGARAPLVARFPDQNYQLHWVVSLAARTVYTRASIYLTSYPTSSSYFTYLTYGFDQTGTVRVATTGRITINNTGGTVVVTSTDPIPLNQWVRVEAKITIGTSSSNGSCELRVYHNADSTTPTDTKTATGVNFNTQTLEEVWFTGVNGTTIYIDDVGISDVNWIGSDKLDTEVSPGQLSASVSLPVFDLATGIGIRPEPVIGSGSVFSPEIHTASNTTQTEPPQVQAIWDLLPPTVEAFRNVAFEPALIEVSHSVIDPVVSVPYNPGDSITASGQVEWNGFLLGSGTPYRLQQLDGWITDMPTLDSGNVTHPSRHGAYPGRKLAQERQVTFSGIITADPDEMSQVVRDLIAISPVMEDDTELPLAVRVLDTTYIGYGSIIRRSIPVDNEYPLGIAKITLQWSMSNPLLLSRDLQSAVVGDGALEVVANIGNAASYPTIRIPGPATNPSIVVQNNLGQERVLEFELEVSEADTLIIDTYYGTATIYDTHVISSLSGSSVPIPDFVLASGLSIIAYSTSGGGASPATVLWRHAYL